MADICSAAAKLAPADPALIKFVTCVLPEGHDGPHYDRAEGVAWRVPTSRAIPRVTQAYLTPSADVPACRDEDPAWPATLNACYDDPHDYDHATHPEDQDGI